MIVIQVQHETTKSGDGGWFDIEHIGDGPEALEYAYKRMKTFFESYGRPIRATVILSVRDLDD